MYRDDELKTNRERFKNNDRIEQFECINKINFQEYS